MEETTITICDKIMLTMKNRKGNVYLPFGEMFMDCMEQDQELSRKEFCDGITQLIQDGKLDQEEDRLYIPKVKTYEDTVAGILAELLSENQMPHVDIPEGPVLLCAPQVRWPAICGSAQASGETPFMAPLKVLSGTE